MRSRGPGNEDASYPVLRRSPGYEPRGVPVESILVPRAIFTRSHVEN